MSDTGKMTKIIKGATVVGALLALTGCASGSVEDKRAVGDPGSKIFQLKIDGFLPDHWVTVTEREWDNCWLEDPYPGCEG